MVTKVLFIIYLKDEKLKKQLNYANNKGIPLVVIIGPDEQEKGIIGLRDMRKKTQLMVPMSDMIEKMNEIVNEEKEMS